MPAGDLVTLPWQVELRGVLTGEGTDFIISRRRGTPFTGLDMPEAKLPTVDLGHAPGSFAGRSYSSDRTITISYHIKKPTQAAAGAAFVTLRNLWDTTTPTAIPLYLNFPGFGKIRVNGFPSGLRGGFEDFTSGVVDALATFYCPDPSILTESTKTVTNKALTSNVATLTTSAAHGFVTGRQVTVAGVDATFNGDYTITGTPTATTFTYAKTATNVVSVASGGSATSYV